MRGRRGENILMDEFPTDVVKRMIEDRYHQSIHRLRQRATTLTNHKSVNLNEQHCARAFVPSTGAEPNRAIRPRQYRDIA